MKRCGLRKHKPGCRPGRPLCKARRVKRWGQCDCGCVVGPHGRAYPHRMGGGKCLYSQNTQNQLAGVPF